MQAIQDKCPRRGMWSVLLAGCLAAFPLASSAAEPYRWPYLDRVKEAEVALGGPGVFAQLEALQPAQRAAILEEKRGLIDRLMNMRSLTGDAAGTAQAALWFEIANGHPARYAADSGKPLESAVSEDAVQAIVREARHRQIVILNEAHHIPLHRVFAARLAAELKKIGYEYLAAETFTTTIPARPALVTADLGFYLKEPMYAEFLRSAARDGWSFVGYDHVGTGSMLEREIGAARNIVEKVFAGNPRAKLFMYVGYGHASKQRAVSEGGWKSVATLLRDQLGMDPLTIDQATMYGRGDVRTDHPQYRVAMQRFAPSKPIVLKAASGGHATIGLRPGSFDMQVFHPDETALTKAGRPLWMERQAGLKPRAVPASLVPASGRRLVQAFHTGDGAGAVPADQVMVEAGKPVPSFMLPEGEFRFGYEE